MFLSAKSSWGDSFFDAMAKHIKDNNPNIKGFNRRGLYRMRQFYETYKDNEFVSALLTQINWSSHLLILSGAKTMEEREFYIQLCAREKYTYRELPGVRRTVGYVRNFHPIARTHAGHPTQQKPAGDKSSPTGLM